MIRISPYHPEIDAIWQAIASTGARSVAVVAAQPGEGTSHLAAALARRAAIAATVERPDDADPGSALLVDFDLVRPAQVKLWELTPELDEIVRPDGLNLGILGRVSTATAGVWRERPRLVEQLALWRNEWTTVVLDASPLLNVERRRGNRGSAADRRAPAESGEVAGITVASAAEACILVTLAGRTSGNRVREAREKLASAGANLIGSVLNDRENPSLLAELDRETFRFSKRFPNTMAKWRARLHKSPILTARV